MTGLSLASNPVSAPTAHRCMFDRENEGLRLETKHDRNGFGGIMHRNVWRRGSGPSTGLTPAVLQTSGEERFSRLTGWTPDRPVRTTAPKQSMRFAMTDRRRAENPVREMNSGASRPGHINRPRASTWIWFVGIVAAIVVALVIYDYARPNLTSVNYPPASSSPTTGAAPENPQSNAPPDHTIQPPSAEPTSPAGPTHTTPAQHP